MVRYGDREIALHVALQEGKRAASARQPCKATRAVVHEWRNVANAQAVMCAGSTVPVKGWRVSRAMDGMIWLEMARRRLTSHSAG